MGYHKSTNLGLETPEAGNSPAITADLLKLANQIDAGVAPAIAASAVSVTATARGIVQATAAITVTSPAAATGAVFTVLANGHAVTVKAASGKIYGDFIEGATEVKLVGYQHVILVSDGTNWFIIAGEPKREATYGTQVSRTSNTEYEPSATRPTEVIVSAAQGFTGTNLNCIVWCGGKVVGAITCEGVKTGEQKPSGCCTFVVNPGEKWKAVTASGNTIESTYRTL